MSAATKAKIASSMKGNKNAYKSGGKKSTGSKKPGRGDLGGKRNKSTGIKQIRNKGYGKRRAAVNLAGAAAVGVLTLGSVSALARKNKVKLKYRDKAGPTKYTKGGIPHRNAPGSLKHTKGGIPYRSAAGATKRSGGGIPYRSAPGALKTVRGRSGTQIGVGSARAGIALAIGSAVARSHKVGMAKRRAKKSGVNLVIGKRKGRTNVYVPTQTRRQKRKAAKKKGKR